VLRAAISAEELMVARYAAAVSSLDASLPPRPTRADTASLTAIREVQAQHADHLAALKSRLVEPSGSSPSPSPSPSVRVTGSLRAVLSMLEQAEETASARLLSQLDGLPGSLAQLFASIAASEATHVPFLHAAEQAR
jgi:Ferritin-like domain